MYIRSTYKNTAYKQAQCLTTSSVFLWLKSEKTITQGFKKLAASQQELHEISKGLCLFTYNAYNNIH